MRISTRMRVGVAISLLGMVVILTFAYLSLGHYPRIVRSAYYKNPVYVLRAVCAQYCGSKAVGRTAAVTSIKAAGFTPRGNPQFLYLLHEPDAASEKPIIDCYFGLLCKVRIDTSESAFWLIPVTAGLTFVEVQTGRIIHIAFDADGTATPQYLMPNQLGHTPGE